MSAPSQTPVVHPDPVADLDFSVNPPESDDSTPQADEMKSAEARSEAILESLRRDYQLQDDKTREKEQREEEAERKRLINSINSRKVNFIRSSETPLNSLDWALKESAIHMNYEKKTKILFLSCHHQQIRAQLAAAWAGKFHSTHLMIFAAKCNSGDEKNGENNTKEIEESKNKFFESNGLSAMKLRVINELSSSDTDSLPFSVVISLSDSARDYYMNRPADSSANLFSSTTRFHHQIIENSASASDSTTDSSTTGSDSLELVSSNIENFVRELPTLLEMLE